MQLTLRIDFALERLRGNLSARDLWVRSAWDFRADRALEDLDGLSSILSIDNFGLDSFLHRFFPVSSFKMTFLFSSWF